ncbi:GlxA family transcriptional regulator [Azospirillum canadense]|uniref:GlxA family transcriptional regulator n=1 Tax=Azospirillum canadense TaxID=403962 RepID=UPI003873B300|nr:transcriptional regulator GlxA family with amidase domain [Azospirillum canadense]
MALLAFPGVQLLDVVGPLDVFAEAGRQLGDPNAYTTQVIGLSPAPIIGSSGLRLLPDRTIEDPDEGAIDTLLVAGGPTIQDYPREPTVQKWLKRQAATARRYGSVCSGAFVLGAAGLLDGHRVTTHWRVADELATAFPEATVEPDCIFVCDGPLYTSAGVTAGMDLALALVEEDWGRPLALAVARELVMFLKRPGGQSQFSAHLAAQSSERSAIQAVQAWVLDNLTGDLAVNALAKRANMSARNFARVFRLEAHMTPGDFVEAARVDAARRMLEDTDTPLQRVAARCGFGNTNALRRAFLRRLQVTPGEYRRRFEDVATDVRQTTPRGKVPRTSLSTGMAVASRVEWMPSDGHRRGVAPYRESLVAACSD